MNIRFFNIHKDELLICGICSNNRLFNLPTFVQKEDKDKININVDIITDAKTFFAKSIKLFYIFILYNKLIIFFDIDIILNI